MYSIYILYSEKYDKYYVGQTEDINKRLKRHNEKTENKFTSKYKPWELKLEIRVETRALAMSLEKYIKGRKSKKYIKSLIFDPNQVEKLKKRYGI